MKVFFGGFVFILCAIFPFLAHGEFHPCTGFENVDEKCKIRVRDLHPTQFSVGMAEVMAKARKFDALSDDELREYLEKNPAPVVIGPENIFYIVDHHHRAAALLKIGKDKMIVQVLKTARTIDLPGFWSRMVKNNLAFLYDEQGRGPRSPADLPESIDRLKDDPYRSLAWAVREAGGYRKTEVPFAEFQWAQFFRARIEIDPGAAGFKHAVALGMREAQSRDARDLPGYKNPR